MEIQSNKGANKGIVWGMDGRLQVREKRKRGDFRAYLKMNAILYYIYTTSNRYIKLNKVRTESCLL